MSKLSATRSLETVMISGFVELVSWARNSIAASSPLPFIDDTTSRSVRERCGRAVPCVVPDALRERR
jgi:hypothetical protein